MKFWDSSALVPLLATEPRTPEVQAAVGHDPEVIVWWASQVECASAVARLEREGALAPADASEALARLDAVASAWSEVLPCDEIREIARRLLRTHPLRAADAMQLAAAWLAAEHRPSSLAFVTFDDRLREAARREGFVVDALGVS